MSTPSHARSAGPSVTMPAAVLAQSMAGGPGMTSGKKQRECYVGNLTIGAVTDQMLRELFNGALAHLVLDPINNPAVVNASLDPSGAPPASAEPAQLQRPTC